jgi:uridine kinase
MGLSRLQLLLVYGQDIMGKTRMLGIAGGSGSGKSWLAHRIARLLPGQVGILQADWYYRDRSRVRGNARLRLNFDHPRAIEVTLLAKHLKQLAEGRPIEAPRYDYSTHRRLSRPVTLRPKPIIIVDGLFVLHERVLLQKMDYTVYLDVPAEDRLFLRLRRDRRSRQIDIDEVLRLYETFVRPMHEKFVHPSRCRADEIWPGLPNDARTRKLVRRLRGWLHE